MGNLGKCAAKGCLSDCRPWKKLYIDVKTGPKTGLTTRIKKSESVKNETWHRIANQLVSNVSQRIIEETPEASVLEAFTPGVSCVCLFFLFQVSRITKDNLEERLFLRIFRFNADNDARVPVRPGEQRCGADVAWWKLAALKQISARVTTAGVGAAFKNHRVPTAPPLREPQGFGFIQELRQAQVEQRITEAQEQAGKRKSTGQGAERKKSRAHDPAEVTLQPPSTAAEKELYLGLLATAQADGKTGKAAHAEASSQYILAHGRSRLSQTGAAAFPGNPTTVAMVTAQLKKQAKEAAKLQGLEKAAALTSHCAPPPSRAAGTSELPRSATPQSSTKPSAVGKRKFPEPTMPSQKPRPAPDAPLEPEIDQATEKGTRRVKNDSRQLAQGKARNEALMRASQEKVRSGEAVTPHNVDAMASQLLLAYLRAMKSGALGDKRSIMGADGEVKIKSDKAARIEEIKLWFQRHSAAEFKLE